MEYQHGNLLRSSSLSVWNESRIAYQTDVYNGQVVSESQEIYSRLGAICTSDTMAVAMASGSQDSNSAEYPKHNRVAGLAARLDECESILEEYVVDVNSHSPHMLRSMHMDIIPTNFDDDTIMKPRIQTYVQI